LVFERIELGRVTFAGYFAVDEEWSIATDETLLAVILDDPLLAGGRRLRFPHCHFLVEISQEDTAARDDHDCHVIPLLSGCTHRIQRLGPVVICFGFLGGTGMVLIFNFWWHLVQVVPAAHAATTTSSA
jgi:hypothetical protein